MDDKQAIATISTNVSWIKMHEKLILGLCLLLVVLWLGNKKLTNDAVAAKTAYGVALQESNAAKAQAIQAASTVAQIESRYQAMVVTLTEQNKTLSNAIIGRNAGLNHQQGSDAQLPLSGLSNRLQMLGNAPIGTVSNTETAVVLTQVGAIAVVQTLEEVPILQGNLADETKIAQNIQQELGQSGQVVDALHIQVTSLNKELTTQDNTCKLQVASVKASERKSKRTWFLIGFASGLATRLLGRF